MSARFSTCPAIFARLLSRPAASMILALALSLVLPTAGLQADLLYMADSANNTIYQYDTSSQLTTVYDNTSRVSDPTALSYDANHHRLYVADNANGNIVLYHYDTLSRVATTDATINSATATATAYDAMDNRVYIGDRSGTTTVYQYNVGGSVSPAIPSSGPNAFPTQPA